MKKFKLFWRYKLNAHEHIKCMCCLHIETSQSLCIANKLAGFYMRATPAFNGLNIHKKGAFPWNGKHRELISPNQLLQYYFIWKSILRGKNTWNIQSVFSSPYKMVFRKTNNIVLKYKYWILVVLKYRKLKNTNKHA